MIRRAARWFARPERIPRLLQIASVLTLVALALMLWSVFVPTPMPVMIAMSVGQLVGTLALASYGLAVFLDLFRVRRERRAQRASEPPP